MERFILTKPFGRFPAGQILFRVSVSPLGIATVNANLYGDPELGEVPNEYLVHENTDEPRSCPRCNDHDLRDDQLICIRCQIEIDDERQDGAWVRTPTGFVCE